jgi:hypothetical protein
MSTKFEQLLDFLVNEEMDKANELFHEIVVEKSREIYENLIAEEAEEGQEESVEEADEEGQEESVEEALEDESFEMEDSFEMDEEDEGDEEPEVGGMEKTGDFHDEITDGEPTEDEAIMDMKAAFDELKAALEKMERAQGGEASSEFDAEEPAAEDEMTMGAPAFEGRRVTREYVEKVGDADWAGGSQKGQGQLAGAGTGEKLSAPKDGASPVAKLSKPSIGDTSAKNIVAKNEEGQNNTGTKPNAVNKGVAPESSEKFAKGSMANSAPGAHTKGYSNKTSVAQGEGHAAGAGTGENSVKGATNTKPVVRKV